MLCTPSVVGMLKERGYSLAKIAETVDQPITLVTRYWLEWRRSPEHARASARTGTNLDGLLAAKKRRRR